MRLFKILKKAIFVLDIAAAFSFISCMGMFNSKIEKEDAYLKIGGSIARTANPEISSLSDFTQFTLTGTKSGESVKSLGSWTTFGAMTSANIAVSAGTWDFTLIAQNSGAIYSGTKSSVVIKSGANSISFTLSFNSWILEGEGNFSLTFTFPEDGADSVTTSLLSYPAFSEISGYNKTLTVSGGSTLWEEEGVSSGTYIAAFTAYKDSLELNTAHILVNVVNSLTSKGIIEVSSLSDIYSITFEANSGIFISSYTLPVSYTMRSDTITLPTSSEIARSEYTFEGWYETSDFSGTVVTEIAGGSTGNKTFYAKWTESSSPVTSEGYSNSSMAFYGTNVYDSTTNMAITSVSVTDDGDNLIVTVKDDDGFIVWGKTSVSVLVDNTSCDSENSVLDKNGTWPTVGSVWPAEAIATSVTEESSSNADAWAQLYVGEVSSAGADVTVTPFITYVASSSDAVKDAKSGLITVTASDGSEIAETITSGSSYEVDFDTDTLNFTIPLECIGGAVKGDELKILVVRTSYYYDSGNYWGIGDACPNAALLDASDTTVWATSSSTDSSVSVNLADGISYTIVNDSSSSSSGSNGSSSGEESVTAYVLVSSLEDGEEYVIAGTNAAGDTYILDSASTSNTYSYASTIHDAEDSSDAGNIFILEDDAISTATWTASSSSSGFTLNNGSKYVEASGSSSKISMASSATSSRYWTYSSNKLGFAGGSSTHYLVYSSGVFSSTKTSSSGSTLYIFKKTTISYDSSSSGSSSSSSASTETSSASSSTSLNSNYKIESVSVTDDGTNLIVTVENENGWAFWANTGVHVFVDNTSVTSSNSIFGASNPWYENENSGKYFPQTLSTSSYQNESDGTSIEAWASFIIDESGYANPVCSYIKNVSASLTEAVSITVKAGSTTITNKTSYTASDYLYSTGVTTLKFYIPFSYIGGVSDGDELRVCAVSVGYDSDSEYRNYVLDACPSAALRDSSDSELTPAWSCQDIYVNLADQGISHTFAGDSSSGSSGSSGSSSTDSGYMRGVDVSTLYDLEADGALFYNASGTQKDMLTILSESGVNWIRLRVWNNPSSSTATPGLANYGYCTIAKAASIGARAKALGMKILLDLHYSDTWADPSYQLVPYEWRSYSTVSTLASAMADFTTDCLQTMADAGADVDMIQIGNEINNGLFIQSYSNGTPSISCQVSNSSSSNFKTVMAAAISAVRSYDSDIKIMLHLAHNYSSFSWSYAFISSLDFDVLGLSYYPFLSAHGTIANVKSTIQSYVSAGKEVCLAETSFPWTVEKYASDGVNNTCWYYDSSSSATTGTYPAYTNLSSITSTYSIATGTYSSKNVITASEANQKAVMQALFTEVKDAGGSGIFYWGGDWVSNCSSGSASVASGESGIGSTWENQALFDLDHQALSVLEAFADNY